MSASSSSRRGARVAEARRAAEADKRKPKRSGTVAACLSQVLAHDARPGASEVFTTLDVESASTAFFARLQPTSPRFRRVGARCVAAITTVAMTNRWSHSPARCTRLADAVRVGRLFIIPLRDRVVFFALPWEVGRPTARRRPGAALPLSSAPTRERPQSRFAKPSGEVSSARNFS